jgi:hypothetical protein
MIAMVVPAMTATPVSAVVSAADKVPSGVSSVSRAPAAQAAAKHQNHGASVAAVGGFGESCLVTAGTADTLKLCTSTRCVTDEAQHLPHPAGLHAVALVIFTLPDLGNRPLSRLRAHAWVICTSVSHLTGPHPPGSSLVESARCLHAQVNALELVLVSKRPRRARPRIRLILLLAYIHM